MKQNVKIAKELIKLAKSLIASEDITIQYHSVGSPSHPSDHTAYYIDDLSKHGTYTGGVGIMGTYKTKPHELDEVAHKVGEKLSSIKGISDAVIYETKYLKRKYGFDVLAVVEWIEDAGWQDEPDGQDPEEKIIAALKSISGCKFRMV